jgi:drug/metabolite transporter (DMT)-like permease
MTQAAPRLLPAALAATAGSVMVGFMPIIARQLYADGIGAPSMLLWRYAIALPALMLAAAAIRLDIAAAFHGGAWRIALVGATLGAGQTLCFWESLKTLDTSIAVLLFYTYPALTLVLDRVLFGREIRPAAMLCVAIILAGAALITLPGVRNGTLDPGGLAWALPAPLIYVFYLAANSVLLRRHPPLAGALCLYLGMTVTFAGLSLARGLDVPATADTWLMLVFIALGPGALTITLFSYSVPLLGPSSYAIIANLELVTVVAVGVTLLGEPVTPERAGGGLLILVGIVGYGLLRRKNAPHPDPLPASGAREHDGAVETPRPVYGEREGPARSAGG